MSADTLEFLKNKFMDDLREAENEHLPHDEIPLHSSFKGIRDILQSGQLTCSPDCMKECLNRLNIILTDCIISLEKRRMQRKKDSSLGPCPLPDLQNYCTTRRELLDIKKKLLSVSEASQAKSSLPASTSWSCSSLSMDQIPLEIDKQIKEIDHLLVGASKRGEGIIREIGIVGLGGSGKTLVARKIFDIHLNDYRIWIDLSKIQVGEVEFKNILKAMLEQCSHEQHRDMINYKDYSEEELLEEVHKVLGSRKYLIVFDGIWNINLEWYSRLKQRLERDNKSKQDRNGIIIITTRLPGVAKRMVGSQNLYHMQPISNEATWKLFVSVPVDDKGVHLPEQHGFLLKMKNQIEENCDGLPLAGKAVANIMAQYTIGEEFKFENLGLLIVNSKDSPKLGKKDLITSCRSIFQQFLVCDISEIASHQAFDDFYQVISTPRLNLQTPEKILVFGGDATLNRVLGALSDREGLPQPLVAMVPLGNEVNIPVSLGWGKQVTETDPEPKILLANLRDATEISIDSWNVVMRVSIPNGLKLQNTVHIKQLSKKEILFKGGDKELRARFWNYFIIGLDAQEWHDPSGFKSWSRNATLPVSVKIKDQGQWKKLDFPHSIKSIVCLNMPSFPGGLNPWGLPKQKKKQRNFTASYVDDQLLEVIGFKDAWHGENFLPSDIHGTRLAQVDRIQFELQKGAAKHVYMSFDGTKWKQPIPEDDDTYPIGISYSCATKMLATSTSICKLKALPGKDEPN